MLQHREKCQDVEKVVFRDSQRELAVPLGAVGDLGEALPYDKFVEHVYVVPAVHKKCQPILRISASVS